MKIVFLVFVTVLLSACQSNAQTPTPTISNRVITPTETLSPEVNGPEVLNPLTGQPAADASLLRIPALLISISHFPATARPQAGLSFAPFVYEFYITEGATRFLAVFYGEFPKPEIPQTGGCETRQGPFVKTSILLGNRVWLDDNHNGIQDPEEEGISGVCVNLFDISGNMVQRTTTDSNGYFGFNVSPGKYIVEFVKPVGMDFTQQNNGEASVNSDANPSNGGAEVQLTSDVLTIDAGLYPTPGITATPNPFAILPLAQVGPIRSGRLIYSYIGDYFQNSCLIFAFASPEELARLPQCHMVFHQLTGGGYMMDISEMEAVAAQNRREKGSRFNYTSNQYTDLPSSQGVPATQLNVFFAFQNQSGWFYDPLYQAYLRYVDTSEFDQAGVLHADVDRLTGRQLHFENLIVLFARHEVITPTNLDIKLGPHKTGSALLFRDGQMFNIRWSTIQPQDKQPGEAAPNHPIQFLNPDGSPAALKPGHTWIIVVTPNSTVAEKSPGQWLLTFAFPSGAQ